MNLYNIFYISVYFLNKILHICGILFQKQSNTKVHTSLKCVKIQVYRPTLRLTGPNQTAPHSPKRPLDRCLNAHQKHSPKRPLKSVILSNNIHLYSGWILFRALGVFSKLKSLIIWSEFHMSSSKDTGWL